MTLFDYAGVIVVAAIWSGIIWWLCRTGLDDDPDERDPYN